MVLLLAACTSISTAQAQGEVKQLTTQPGGRVSLGHHVHFRASTCQTLSIPSIHVVRPPVAGRLEVAREPLVMERASDERWSKCVGSAFDGARVYYIASPGWSGVEEVTYAVSYPPECKGCTNRNVTAIVTVAPAVAPPSLAPSAMGGPETPGRPAGRLPIGRPPSDEALLPPPECQENALSRPGNSSC